MKTHKDLEVRKESIDVVERIYIQTKSYPEDEKYSLVSQMRRASVAVPSNIAEGYARNTLRDQIRFLYISLSSLSELETQVIISDRLKYLNSKKLMEQIEIIRKKFLNMIKYHKSKL